MLLLLQIAAKSFQSCPEFSFQWSSQNCFEDFWNFELPIFDDFFFYFWRFVFENFKFTIFGEIKTQLFGKWAIVEQSGVKSGTCGYSSSTYVRPCSAQGYLGAFGALAIFMSLLFTKATASYTNHSTAEMYPTSPEFSCQWASQNYVWDFWNFENWNFNELCSFSLTWDPMGAKISKRYSSYNSKSKIFKLVLNCSPNCPHKTTLAIFEILEFLIFNYFLFEEFKFTIVPYGETKNLN